jgi:hypothetical protein
MLSVSMCTVLFLTPSYAESTGLCSSAFRRLEIVEVLANETTAYDEPLTVRVLVTHEPYLLPEVSVFYMPILQNRTIGTVWRISPARLAQAYPGVNETLYEATLPNLAWGDELPAGTMIVYYVEARDASGSVSTALQQDRFNPFVTDDKFILRLVDLKPPSISDATITPVQPTSTDDVTVTVSVTDGRLGSGLATVTLSYSVDDGRFTDVRMTLLENDQYTGTIPAQQQGRKVVLLLTATDRDGNKNSTRTRMSEYVVQKSVDEIAVTAAAKQRTYLILGSVLGVTILCVSLLKRRTLAALIKRPQAAFSVGMLLVFLVVARVTFVLWQNWALWWWNAIILLALVEFWALVDPRIQGTARPFIRATLGFGRSIVEYLSRTFQENPPTILVAAAYVLGFGGAVCDVIWYLAYRDTHTAYALANFIAEYVFILLALGVIGQLIFLARRRQDLSKASAQSGKVM